MNLDIKYALLPAMIRLFIVENFDLRMIDDQNMSELVFTLAAFIAPKQVMKSFEVTKQTVFESVFIHKISEFYKKQTKKSPYLASCIQYLQDQKA